MEGHQVSEHEFDGEEWRKMHSPRIYHADVEQVSRWSYEKLKTIIPRMRQEFLGRIAEQKASADKYRKAFTDRSEEIARLRREVSHLVTVLQEQEREAVRLRKTLATNKKNKPSGAGLVNRAERIIGRKIRSVETVATHLL